MKKAVLIVGGGFAGIEAAKELAPTFQVTLLDFKDYFQFTPGIMRALIKPQYYKAVTASYAEMARINSFKFMKGELVELTQRKAFIKMGEEIVKVKFDYAIVCCGADYFQPIKPHRVFEAVMDERRETVSEYREELEDAEQILIVGGGPVAVELAAEIITEFPHKNVDLTTHSSKLLKNLPQLAQIYVQRILKEKGLRIYYNTILESEEKYDLIFRCTGISFKTEFLNTHFEQCLTDTKRIKVNQYLQMTENIFAAGDIAETNLPLTTTAFVAEEEGLLAAQNLRCLSLNLPMRKNRMLPTFYCLNLGHDLGLTIIGGLIIPGKFQTYLKNIIKFFKLSTLSEGILSSSWMYIHHCICFLGSLL